MNRFFFDFGLYLYLLFVVLWLNFCGVVGWFLNFYWRRSLCIPGHHGDSLWARGNEQDICGSCLVVKSLLQILIKPKLKFSDTLLMYLIFIIEVVYNPLWQIFSLTGVFKFQNYIEIDDILCGLGFVWSVVLLISHLIGHRIAISLLCLRAVC